MDSISIGVSNREMKNYIRYMMRGVVCYLWLSLAILLSLIIPLIIMTLTNNLYYFFLILITIPFFVGTWIYLEFEVER